MSDKEIVEALESHGCSWKDYILVGDPPAISRWRPPTAILGLVIDDEELWKQTVEFLRRSGARSFASVDDVKRAFGWDGLARVETKDDHVA
jgi:hypothetical protein